MMRKAQTDPIKTNSRIQYTDSSNPQRSKRYYIDHSTPAFQTETLSIIATMQLLDPIPIAQSDHRNDHTLNASTTNEDAEDEKIA